MTVCLDRGGHESPPLPWIHHCVHTGFGITYMLHIVQDKMTNAQACSIHLINERKRTLWVYWHLVTLLVAGSMSVRLRRFSDSRSFQSPSGTAQSSWPRSSLLAPTISTQQDRTHELDIKKTALATALLTWVKTHDEKCFTISRSGSRLAWANDTVVHYAAIHWPRQHTTGPSQETYHCTTLGLYPIAHKLLLISMPLRVAGWVDLSTQ